MKTGPDIILLVIDDQVVEVEAVDDTHFPEDGFSGWYCIATDPWHCKCGDFIAHHVTALHYIVVWPEKDHPYMLRVAAACSKHGRNPNIVEYEVAMGPAVSFYEFEAMGNIACIGKR